MSQNIKQKILDRALALYNEHGVPYVGVRELAKDLQLKGGNINYYFPTKEDIVLALVQGFQRANEVILNQEREHTFYHFLDIHQKAYDNQHNYRSIIVSRPLLLKQYSKVKQVYQEVSPVTKEGLFDELKVLLMSGFIQGSKVQELDAMLECIITMNRYWLSDVSIYDNNIDKEVVIIKYLKRIAGLLYLVANEKGRADIDRFIKELA